MTDSVLRSLSSSENDRHLHVLFINDTSRNGGPGKTLLNILKYLDPNKIKRSVMLPQEELVSRRIRENNAAEIVLIEPAMIENLFQPLSRVMTRHDFEAPFTLRWARAIGNIGRAVRGIVGFASRVRQARYDVVFYNVTTACYIGGLLAVLPGAPPVIWHVFYPGVPPFLRPLHRWLASGNGVKAIICVSKAVTSQFHLSDDKVQVLHDAIDIGVSEISAEERSPFSLRVELGVEDSVVLFGAHGRILPQKGFYELIEVARLLVTTLGPEAASRCRFVVLGDTPQDSALDHLKLCRSKVKELGMEGFMHFIGFRADVRPYLADFDVAMVPSVYPDPLPLSVMEAMAMGKPIIGFDMGGIGEMVRNGQDGALLPGVPADIQGMADACHDALIEREKWRLRGLAARQRVEQHFDARPHATAIQNLLLRLGKKEKP